MSNNEKTEEKKCLPIALPKLRSADYQKWLNNKNASGLLECAQPYTSSGGASPNAFFIEVLHDNLESNFVSEGFRNADLLLVEPTEKITFHDRFLVKILKKGIWVCYMHQLPSGSIGAVYKESKDKADTVVIKEDPLSFIAGNKFFFGSEKAVLEETEIFRILGLYRSFQDQ